MSENESFVAFYRTSKVSEKHVSGKSRIAEHPYRNMRDIGDRDMQLGISIGSSGISSMFLSVIDCEKIQLWYRPFKPGK